MTPSKITWPGLRPWIGDRYATESTKILVLGESHHLQGGSPARSPTSDDLEATERYTRQYVERQWNNPFWSKVGTLVALLENWSNGSDGYDPRITFERIAFYNFIYGMLSGHRDWPSKEVVEVSRALFVNTLDLLKPDFVIALGSKKMPWFLSEIPQFQYLLTSRDALVAIYCNTTIASCCHPSGRFSYIKALDALRHGRALVTREREENQR